MMDHRCTAKSAAQSKKGGKHLDSEQSGNHGSSFTVVANSQLLSADRSGVISEPLAVGCRTVPLIGIP
jgi:hypothetical protein